MEKGTKMIICKATEKDFEQYYLLQQKYNQEIDPYYHKDFTIKINKKEYHKEFLKRINKKSGLILVAKEKNKIIGLFEGTIFMINKEGLEHKIDKVGYINNVFITQKYRGNQLFSKFLNQYECFLRNKKIKHYSLNVSKINKRAIKAYIKEGLKIQEYRMQKVLK